VREQLGRMFGCFIGVGAALAVVEGLDPPTVACFVIGLVLAFLGTEIGGWVST
jgi:hypothetical protein